MPRSRVQRAPRPGTVPARSILARESDAEPIRVVRARGNHVVAADGRRYLDLAMGWCVGNLGWAQRDVTARLRRFDGPDYVWPHFEYAPWTELAKRLVAVAPGRMARAFRATGGTEAVEIALQAAFAATKRRKVVSLEGSYHGNSLLTRGLGGGGGKLDHALHRGIARVKPPLDESALPRVERALWKGDVAAFIMEPIPINLGVLVPTEEFMLGVEALCREHGTLLVLDEVATGFGRTGKLFASEHYRVEPDIVCLAKGLTAGYAPMGATLTTEEVASKVEKDATAYSTYGWHPRSVEAALAVLDRFEESGATLLENVEARGRQFEEGLQAMELGDAEVRVKGLAIAVVFEDEARPEEIVKACRKKGLLVGISGDRLVMLPALDIDERTVARALRILATCV